MDKKRKQTITIISLVVILVIAVLGLIYYLTKGKSNSNEPIEEYVEVQADGSKVNISSKLSETKVVEDLNVNNFKLQLKDGVSMLTANVENTTDKASGGYNVEIKVLNKKGNELIKMSVYIGNIEPGQAAPIDVAVGSDFVNAYDIQITKIKEPKI